MSKVKVFSEYQPDAPVASPELTDEQISEIRYISPTTGFHEFARRIIAADRALRGEFICPNCGIRTDPPKIDEGF